MSRALSRKKENLAEMTMQIDPTGSQGKARPIRSGRKQPCFLVMGGLDIGKVIPINAGIITVGRDPKCDLILRDDGISRFHAEITYSDSNYVLVRDLESTNGTFIGGNRITEAKLSEGEKVVLGRRTVLKYLLQDELEKSYQEKMYESSTRDSLTGVFNRRYFVQKIVADLSFARRHGIPFALLFIDIDYFKKVNDTYGHLTGDKVLVAVTRTMKEMIRTEDLLARYGGEEFAIIAQGTDLAGGHALAERIRLEIAKIKVEASDDPRSIVGVTVSLGVAFVPPGTAADPEAVVSKADKNLYEAKESGRNRTVATEME